MKWCISVYIVSNISQVILVFVYWGYLWGYLDKKEATIFHIYGQKIFSHKAIWLKFRPSFTKLLRNLTIISICGKTRLQQLRKIKYSILASVLHIFHNFFLAEPHTHLHNTLCKSHDFLVFCFESWHIVQYCDFLEKFILPFFFVPTRYKHILRVAPSPMPFLNFIFHFFTQKTSNLHVVYGAFIFKIALHLLQYAIFTHTHGIPCFSKNFKCLLNAGNSCIATQKNINP